MHNHNTAQDGSTNQQIDSLLAILTMPVKFLCAMASFPYASFKLLHNNGDRGDILTRGTAVLISSSACAMALGKNAEVVFGYSIYGYFLTLAAFILDWQIVKTTYDDISGWFSRVRNGLLTGALRVALVLIGAALAFTSALLGESSNLQKNLFQEQQQQAVLSNPEIGLLDQRIFARQNEIMDNEVAIQDRGTLESKRIEELRLADNQLFKGGCKDKCNTHKANAAATQSRLDSLDALVAKNEELRKKIVGLKTEREALIVKNLSDSHSIGTLIAALPYADDGVKLKICGNVFILVFLEFLAMGIAHLRISQSIRDAINYLRIEDERRLREGHKSRMSEIFAEQAKNRALYGASLTPIIVKIPSAPQPTHNTQAPPLHVVSSDNEGEGEGKQHG